MDEASRSVVRVRALAHGGAGVGSEPGGEGPTWLVDGALPGEVVQAAAVHRAKRHVKGRVLEVIEASDARVEPPCSLAGTCGGCRWQHVAAPRQGELKRGIVVDQLRKLVPADHRVALAYQGEADGYRRRARLHYSHRGSFSLGFYAARTRDVIDVPRCPVLHPVLRSALEALRGVASALPDEGEVLAADRRRGCDRGSARGADRRLALAEARAR